MSRLTASAVLLFLLGMLGCRNVRPSELAGNRVMEDSSRSLLPAESRAAAATLELNADGTFVASQVPEDLPPNPPYDDLNQHNIIRLDTGSGHWALVSEENEQQVQLSFQTMAGNKDVPYGTQLFISKGLSKVSLFNFLGDPDQGRRISFEKR
jgi:hypothetical protein